MSKDKQSLDKRLALSQLALQQRVHPDISASIRTSMKATLDGCDGVIAAHRAFDDEGADASVLRLMPRGGVDARVGLKPDGRLGSDALSLEDLVCQIVAPGWRRHLPWKRATVRRLVALLKGSLPDTEVTLSACHAGREGKANASNVLPGMAFVDLVQGRATLGADELSAANRNQVDALNVTLLSPNGTSCAVASASERLAPDTNEILLAAKALACGSEQEAAGPKDAGASAFDTVHRKADAMTKMPVPEEARSAISALTGIVQSLALETNLLALNASIKAAVVGETDRADAFGTSEIRALAQRYAQAVDEMKAVINPMSGEVQAAGDLVNSSAIALGSVSCKLQELAQRVLIIAESLGVQHESATRIRSIVSDIGRMTPQHVVVAEEGTAAAAVAAGKDGTAPDNGGTKPSTLRKQHLRLVAG